MKYYIFNKLHAQEHDHLYFSYYTPKFKNKQIEYYFILYKKL